MRATGNAAGDAGAVNNSLKVLGRSLRRLTCLTTLDLSNNIPADCLSALGNCLSNAKKLRNLDLSSNTLCRPSSSSVRAFVKFAQSLPHGLQTVVLRNISLKHAPPPGAPTERSHGAALVIGLALLPELTCLDVSNNGLAEAGVLALLADLTTAMMSRPLARLGVLGGHSVSESSTKVMRAMMEAVNRGAYSQDEPGHILEMW